MGKEFRQIAWDRQVQAEWSQLVRLAIREDLGDDGDWTTRALVPDDAMGSAAIVARRSGVVAGLAGVTATLQAVNQRLRWTPEVDDGHAVQPGDRLGRIDGPAQGILMAERIVLNFVGRLSGIASLTGRYVEAVAGTKARIYDTRKTTPGWRLLEKYAVRCGGGVNHRAGLCEAVLIKDNHLALGTESSGGPYTPADAVERARRFVQDHAGSASEHSMMIEVEVDTLEQLAEVLPARPDIVLLDNMPPDQLREAVAIRDAADRSIELEASGGVSLETVGAIATTGVERISVGALTHSATALDVGLDWIPGA